MPFARLQTPETLLQALPRQQLSQLLFLTAFKAAICRLSNPQTLPQAFPRQQLSQLHATCSSHLFLTAFKAPVCLPSNSPNPPADLSKATTLAATCYMLQPSILKSVEGCRLLAYKPPKTFHRPFQGLPQAFPRQQLSQLHAPAI